MDIYYKVISTVGEEKEVKSVMQFFRFVEDENGVKIAEVWNQ